MLTMDGKLTDEYMDQLESWIGTGPKIFTLLYSITRDGCVSTTFHQKCDNQGPTFTVLYNQQCSVYGGYTSVSWNSSGRYTRDDKAFLYQLMFSGNNKHNKFSCKNPDHAIYAHSGKGPTFGGGHDLMTFSSTVNSSGEYFALNGNMNNYWGHSYDTQGIIADNINNGNLNVTELEVYKVTDGTRQKVQVQPQTLPQKPWRKTPELNQKYLEKLMEEIENVKPMSGVDITEYRILIFGPVGSGKSSFYNTVNSVFRGRVTKRAICGSSKHSTTLTYTPYDVRSKSGSTLKLKLCDIRGLEETLGPDVIEFNYLFDGHIPDFYEFNPAKGITLQSQEFIHKPTINERLHCAALILDGSAVKNMSTTMTEKINGLRILMNQKEIPLAVIITHIDNISDTVKDDVYTVFSCSDVEKVVNNVSSMFGIPLNNILVVKNLHNEMQLEDNVSILALMALQQLLYLAEDYTENLTAKIKRLSVKTQRGDEQDVTESDTA